MHDGLSSTSGVSQLTDTLHRERSCEASLLWAADTPRRLWSFDEAMAVLCDFGGDYVMSNSRRYYPAIVWSSRYFTFTFSTLIEGNPRNSVYASIPDKFTYY
jgi:hypothetical protein